jgi:hypothetical protein
MEHASTSKTDDSSMSTLNALILTGACCLLPAYYILWKKTKLSREQHIQDQHTVQRVMETVIKLNSELEQEKQKPFRVKIARLETELEQEKQYSRHAIAKLSAIHETKEQLLINKIEHLSAELAHYQDFFRSRQSEKGPELEWQKHLFSIEIETLKTEHEKASKALQDELAELKLHEKELYDVVQHLQDKYREQMARREWQSRLHAKDMLALDVHVKSILTETARKCAAEILDEKL